MSELEYKIGELQVIRVEAKSRRLDAKWSMEDVASLSLHAHSITQGPSTLVVHPSIKRATDRREATVWRRLLG